MKRFVTRLLLSLLVLSLGGCQDSGGRDGTAAANSPKTLGAGFDLVSVGPQADLARPRVAARADGSWIVAWLQRDAGALHGRIRAQLLSADASPLLAQPLDAAHGDVAMPVLSVAADSRFALAWTQQGQVWARVFGASGVAMGAPFQINEANQPLPLFPPQSPGVAPLFAMTLAGDQLIAAWLVETGALALPLSPARGVFGLRLQRFNLDGSPRGEVREVGHALMTDILTPTLAAGDGQFVLAWTAGSDIAAGPPPCFCLIYAGLSTVRLQRFDLNGQPLGGERLVGAPGGNDTLVSAAMNRSDEFVLAWRALLGTRQRVVSQAFDAAGLGRFSRQFTGVTDDVSISAFIPATDLDHSGVYAVAWDDPVNPFQPRLQLYRPAALGQMQAAGESLILGRGQEPSVALGDSAALLALWLDRSDSGAAIRGQLFSY